MNEYLQVVLLGLILLVLLGSLGPNNSKEQAKQTKLLESIGKELKQLILNQNKEKK